MHLLPSDRLEAFAAVAAEASFTKGALRIGITQSAISQRIAKLEEDVGVTLFLRSRDAARLTAEGEAVLRYARAREGLESELLARLGTDDPGREELTGVLRIAGFSSVTRSVIMPALSPLVARSEDLTVHAFSRELGELPHLLRSGEADLVVIDRELADAGVTSIELGTERNVLVAPRNEIVRTRCYLDHDPDDATTERFFRLNGKTFAHEQRTYLDDIYGILDGVAQGWGRAVVSAHLIPQFPEIRRIKGYKPLLTGVFLVTRKSKYRSKLHERVIETLRANCRKFLDA
ncbi:MAG: LysR family transcriptional regulator [Myxococcota bacterium]